MKNYMTLFLALLFSAACGSGNSTKVAGLGLNMSTALNDLNLNSLRVTGQVWKVNGAGVAYKLASKERDASRTIRGNYALKVKDLSGDQNYEFRVKIYYKAADFGGALAVKAAVDSLPPSVDIVTPSIGLCPGFSLTPDASLEDGRWLLLCEAAVQTKFSSKNLIEISEDQIHCENYDADGDGMANLTELDESVQPFNGDFDGDCAADNLDAFPKDSTEWLDTDHDGIGDNADVDADNDGILDEAEAALGTDLLNPDSDADGIVDGSDNCPITVNVDQADKDTDKIGNACDLDADNDRLTDADETTLYHTDPFNADTDGDGLIDGTEVTAATNPLNVDTDGDGTHDKEDVFPMNASESVDTDADGVGDNADNCKTVANADQINSDTDLSGNACDTDDDNDGLTDVQEQSIGSNQFNTDTDGDGMQDWFGNGARGAKDPCLLLATGDQTTDADNDGFTVACDCNDSSTATNPAIVDTPDTVGTDNNCDGIDGDVDEAIFVNGTTGNDSNAGTLSAPKKTLSAGGATASSAGKDVYVADGTYTLTSTYTIPSAVLFYGGFNSDFTTHDVSGTTITSSTLSILLDIVNSTAGTGLDGFRIENLLSTSGSPTAIEITDSTAQLSNNVIVVKNALHAAAINAADSALTLTNNNIILSNNGTAAGQGSGVILDTVTGTFTNNTIQIDDFETRIGMDCISAGSSDIKLDGNQMDVWDIVAPAVSIAANTSSIYIRDCSLSASSQHFTLPAGLPDLDVSSFAGFDQGTSMNILGNF